MFLCLVSSLLVVSNPICNLFIVIIRKSSRWKQYVHVSCWHVPCMDIVQLYLSDFANTWEWWNWSEIRYPILFFRDIFIYRFTTIILLYYYLYFHFPENMTIFVSLVYFHKLINVSPTSFKMCIEIWYCLYMKLNGSYIIEIMVGNHKTHFPFLFDEYWMK